MQQLLVAKSDPLGGTLEISGSKNGTLPLLAAAMLVQGETMELVFTVDIREFNPALTWDYERTIAVKKSSNVGCLSFL